ncbi:hypothetical protein ACQPZA_10565 [Pseudonocardia xinjiangensis]|uniref:DUF308 domain-containing protein n=1 Tax=Pseudonocardia xinjiangensis TaxID=75289 RepID=A0ABX1RT02_9PSEU|nr:hypothetical protein [Pseudonocardia xinjiangensis]NMH82286.1 hypothetical protein [Pseudonocardia xinjiangensis]
MNRDPDERAQPDGGAAPDEFDAIVAGWRREGQVPEWPAAAEPAGALFEPRPTTVPEPAPAADDEHFIPPEPPPLPRLGPPALVGLVLLALGLVLIIAPGWVGVPLAYGLPLGLLGLAAGLGWLVLRLWPDPPGDGEDDGDDGAVV